LNELGTISMNTMILLFSLLSRMDFFQPLNQEGVGAYLYESLPLESQDGL